MTNKKIRAFEADGEEPNGEHPSPGHDAPSDGQERQSRCPQGPYGCPSHPPVPRG